MFEENVRFKTVPEVMILHPLKILKLNVLMKTFGANLLSIK
jgi:hypothetical protein